MEGREIEPIIIDYLLTDGALGVSEQVRNNMLTSAETWGREINDLFLIGVGAAAAGIPWSPILSQFPLGL